MIFLENVSELDHTREGSMHKNRLVEISTVFISSRMDEVAVERHAAFAAIQAAGFTPAVFEREPPQKTLQDKERIDSLIANADFFIGIYYLTFGRRFAQYGDMSPIEYELVSFVNKFIEENPELYPHYGNILMDRQKQAKFFDDLRQQCAIGHGPAIDLFRDRVLLYRRGRDIEHRLSGELFDFILGLPCIEFGPEEHKIENSKGRTESYYTTAYLTLFNKIINDLPKKARPKVSIVDEHPIKIAVNVQNRSGKLKDVLFGCFTNSLSLREITLGLIDSSGFQTINITAVIVNKNHYRAYDSEAGYAKSVERRLGAEIETEHGETVRADALKRRPTLYANEDLIGLVREKDNSKILEIIVRDVPGVLMTIAEVVYYSRWNIEFFYSSSNDSDRRGEFYTVVGMIPLGSGDAENDLVYEKQIKKMLYELRFILGVTSAREIAWSEAKQLLERLGAMRQKARKRSRRGI